MANIERTYHDVTTLDKGIALNKVKDIMDISSSAEFFTIVKDPQSIIVHNYEDLEYESGFNNWSHYFKPFTRYKFERARGTATANEVRSITSKFGMRVKVTDIKYEEGVDFIVSEQQTKSWAQSKETILHHLRGMWLKPDPDNEAGAILYFTPVYRGTTKQGVNYFVTTQASDGVPARSAIDNAALSAHAKVPLDKLLLLEFEVYDLIDPSGGTFGDSTSRIVASDTTKIFKYFKRDIYNTSDYADVLMLTQSNANRYSLVISNVEESRPQNDRKNTLPALYNIIKDVYNNRLGQYAILDVAETIIKTNVDSNFDTSSNLGYFEHLDKGPIYIGDHLFFEEQGSFDPYIADKLKSAEGYVLLSDLNHHAATLLEAVLSACEYDVTIHTHNSRQLFRDATFRSITHPTGLPLVIGSPLKGGITFIENIDMSWNDINNIKSFQANNITSNVLLNANAISASTLTVTSDTTLEDLTLTGILSLSGEGSSISLTNMPAKKAASNEIASTNVLIVGSDGVISKIVNNSNINGSLANISTALAADYGDTGYKREFFARDGSFRELSPDYLGAANNSHTHGNITNGGLLETGVTIGTDFHLVVTNTSNAITRTSIAFSATGGENNRTLLSKNGTWNTIKDILYRFTSNEGVVAAANDATSFGIYKVSAAGTTDHPRVINSSTDSSSWESRYLNEGNILTITSNGDSLGANNRVIQIGFGYNQTVYGGNSQSVDSKIDTLFLRSKSLSTGAWSNWTYLARHDHNHDKEYTKLSATGTNLYHGVNIFDDTANFATDSNYYAISFELGSGSGAKPEALHELMSDTAKFVWAIGTYGSVMELDGSNGLTVSTTNTSTQNLDVTGTLTFTKNTQVTGAVAIPIAANDSTILFASKEASNKRIVQTSTFTLKNLTDLNTNFTNHTDQNDHKAAHGNLKSDGTIQQTAASAISTNDSIAIVQNSGAKLAKSAIQFNTADANKTSYLAKTGAWISLPGVWTTSIANNGSASATKTDGTITNGGLISETDIKRLALIYDSFATDDGNNAVDRLKDILAKFSDMEEDDGTVLSQISAVADSANAKLPKAGGNMTGNIGFTDSGGNTKEMIKFLGTNTSYGQGIVIGGGAKTIIRAGEGIANYENTPTEEHLFLTADSNVYIKTNTDSGADSSAKTFTFGSDGKLSLPGDLAATTATFTGTVVFSKATDLSGTANNSPALIIGGAATAEHIEIDSNEIHAKANGTTVGPLYLNNNGGKVYLSGSNSYADNGVLYSEGNKVVTTVSTSGTGLSGGVTAANSTGTITLDSSSAGNAAANKVVLRNAAGSIQTEKIEVSSGTTTKATMQYNSSTGCLEIIC